MKHKEKAQQLGQKMGPAREVHPVASIVKKLEAQKGNPMKHKSLDAGAARQVLQTQSADSTNCRTCLSGHGAGTLWPGGRKQIHTALRRMSSPGYSRCTSTTSFLEILHPKCVSRASPSGRNSPNLHMRMWLRKKGMMRN